jgi:hypothetical protein
MRKQPSVIRCGRPLCTTASAGATNSSEKDRRSDMAGLPLRAEITGPGYCTLRS